MPAQKMTDDEIVAQYQAGVSIYAMRAGDERIKRVLRSRGIAFDLKQRVAWTQGPFASMKDRNQSLIADFKEGVVEEELMRRYGVSKRSLKRIIPLDIRQARGRRVTGNRAPRTQKWLNETARLFRGPELADPERAGTALRRRLIERANAEKIREWQAS